MDLKKPKPITELISKRLAHLQAEIKSEIAVSEAKQHSSIDFFPKLIVAVVLVTLTPLIIPHESIASELKPKKSDAFVFEAGDHTEYLEGLAATAEQASLQIRHEQAVAKLKRQLKMNEALKQYLISKRSPLAEYSHIILQQKNWKKILALANAESTMCRFYPEEYANCWGVGGENLWDMGENLGEGVIAMNHFLNTSPRLSNVKYAQMNFDQMNGLYKQPARDHWVYNNLHIYNELTALEKSIR